MHVLKHAATIYAVLGIALGTGAAAATASAQEAPPDLGIETLTRFARAHLAIAEARDEFHARIGRIHEEQARLQARQELNQEVTRVLEAEELTREEYEHLILVISTDEGTRATFDRILAELATRRPGG